MSIEVRRKRRRADPAGVIDRHVRALYQEEGRRARDGVRERQRIDTGTLRRNTVYRTRVRSNGVVELRVFNQLPPVGKNKDHTRAGIDNFGLRAERGQYKDNAENRRKNRVGQNYKPVPGTHAFDLEREALAGRLRRRRSALVRGIARELNRG